MCLSCIDAGNVALLDLLLTQLFKHLVYMAVPPDWSLCCIHVLAQASRFVKLVFKPVFDHK